ncbi:MAG: Fic family protein [Kiritimatiellae bacterium]|nr:Fic family protein [Kiritimatiellia bacterium]
MYIHELKEWPDFTWDWAGLSGLLAEARHEQGRLLGRMSSLGFATREEASLRILTQDVVNTAEIEGETFNPRSVRSSIARKLGIEEAGATASDRQVDGLVEMLVDATRHYQNPLTEDRLFAWQAALFPTGYSGLGKITVGAWRKDEKGPMQVVSGGIGRRRVHYEAPSADRLEDEMNGFLAWFNADTEIDPVLKSAIAHFYLVTIHPFDDGNGRIARAIADLQLSRADRMEFRFYSMSSQIQREKKAYYDTLEKCQKGSLDISEWIGWYLGCLLRAIGESHAMLASVLKKDEFWKGHAGESFHERQRDMLNRLLDGFEGKLTSSKWATFTKCSQDTAQRDINDLIVRGILDKEDAGGRSTSYRLSD